MMGFIVALKDRIRNNHVRKTLKVALMDENWREVVEGDLSIYIYRRQETTLVWKI